MLLKMQRLLKHRNNSLTPPLKAPNSIEGAALSEQQISLWFILVVWDIVIC